jgi:hypothetical protein
MPSDFAEYINLKIFDKEPGDIYRDALEIARLALPEFNLRTGTPEDAIFQAMAYISSLNIAAINRLPNRLMAGIISIFGYSRQESVPAVVDATITLNTYAGGIIPAGTVFSYETTFEDELIEIAFLTTEMLEIDEVDLEITQNYPSASTTLVCLQGGIVPPINDNLQLKIISSGLSIQSCITNTPNNFLNGINADTDEDYLSKSATYLRSLTSALTKDSQVDAYLLTSYPDIISRVKTYDLTKNSQAETKNITVNREFGIDTIFLNNNLATVNTEENHLYVVGDVVDITIFGNSASATFNGTHEIVATGDTTFSFNKVAANTASTSVTASAYAGVEAAGYVVIFAYGLNDFLTNLQKSQILSDVRSKSVAGLTFEILNPTLVTFNIQGTVVVDESYDVDEVEISIQNILIDYLSPNNYPFALDRVRKNQIISLIASTPGVVYVDDIIISSVGKGWLPKHGDDLLFLNKGTLPIIAAENLNLTFNVWDVE